MKTRFRFEKLEVWQEARVANRTIYRLARKFPRHEMFAMTSQVRRAAISISSNIAEGSGRNSDKDFAHFLEQAYGSLMETASIFYLALDEGCIFEADLDPLLASLEALAKRIAALNRSLHVTVSKRPFARCRNPALDPRLTMTAFQIVFTPAAAAELARMPKELQLQILGDFRGLPQQVLGTELDEFGKLEQGGRILHRFRVGDYRVYFERHELGVLVHRILSRHTLKDFLFRTGLKTGEDEALQENPKFWELIKSARTSAK